MEAGSDRPPRPEVPKGEATIEVFGLQRPVLQQGRARAYVRCRSMLRDWLLQSESGDLTEAS
ncbi:hypothetical protein ABZW10_06035 [Kitasatospora sp. NPDC004723]|uniref:hypothetical protein n=1 Tax=Kitasatospora sp. NPDC004723 TaxID=3154288 RepID=UPI0033A207F6